jgi:hypothetical protein
MTGTGALPAALFAALSVALFAALSVALSVAFAPEVVALAALDLAGVAFAEAAFAEAAFAEAAFASARLISSTSLGATGSIDHVEARLCGSGRGFRFVAWRCGVAVVWWRGALVA